MKEDQQMRLKSAVLLTAICLGLVIGWSPPAAAQETSVTAGAGGIFPPGTTFNGVPINGLQSGYGVSIASGGSALGQFCTVLLGVNALGLQQNIVIVGQASGGSRTAANIATFSGTCSVNMGDGTPPTLGVPFTATITTDANDQGGIGLVIGVTTLPSAVVNVGSMTIK
jgi:hypothetical protein